MITYECPKCGFTYESTVRAVEVVHNCKKSRNAQQPMKEKA